MPSAVVNGANLNGGILGATNGAFDDDFVNVDEIAFADRKREGGSVIDVNGGVAQPVPTTSINGGKDIAFKERGHPGGALRDRDAEVNDGSGELRGRGGSKPDEELDICEIDYEGDPMNDHDDDGEVDDDEEKEEESNERSDEYTTSSSDVREGFTDESNGRKSRSPDDGCLAEVKTNCSKFGRVMRREAREVREGIKHNVRCPSGRKCCTVDKVARRIPIMKWLPKYGLVDLQGDLLAGLTVGLTVIPQSIAYAAIAGVPSQFGLYSAFIGSIIYVFFGTSKDITLGPSAIMSLLSASFASSPVPGDPTYAIILALFTGIVQLGMYCLGLGVIVDFISYPVMKAFTSAAAITIAMSQIKSWLGLKNVPRDFLTQLYWTVKKIPETRLYDLLLGCACIFFIVLFKKLRDMKWKQRYSEMSLGFKILKKSIWLIGIARNVIVIIVASVVAYIFWVNNMKPFTLTGFIPPGIPPFCVPAFSVVDPVTNVTYTFSKDIAPSISVGIVITPIIGLLEAMSIGKPIARKNNYKIDVNQELLPYGIANVLGAFVGAFPVAGTFSRTALNAASGVRTPGGGIVTGVLVLVALQFLTPLFFYIPSASLAVVIIMAVLDMLTFHKVWIFWRTKKIDLIPWLVTFVCSFVISIAYGVFVGMGVSMLLLIYPMCRPKVKIADITVTDNMEFRVVRLNTGLPYPSCDYVKDKIIKMATTLQQDVDSKCKARSVILDWTMVAMADATTVQSVREMLEDLNGKSILVVFCNLQKPVKELFRRARPKHFHSVETLQNAIDFISAIDATKIGDAAAAAAAAADVSAPYRTSVATVQKQPSDVSSSLMIDHVAVV